jgi:hypothetical protein
MAGLKNSATSPTSTNADGLSAAAAAATSLISTCLSCYWTS